MFLGIWDVRLYTEDTVQTCIFACIPLTPLFLYHPYLCIFYLLSIVFPSLTVILYLIAAFSVTF